MVAFDGVCVVDVLVVSVEVVLVVFTSCEVVVIGALSVFLGVVISGRKLCLGVDAVNDFVVATGLLLVLVVESSAEDCFVVVPCNVVCTFGTLFELVVTVEVC